MYAHLKFELQPLRVEFYVNNNDDVRLFVERIMEAIEMTTTFASQSKEKNNVSALVGFLSLKCILL